MYRALIDLHEHKRLPIYTHLDTPLSSPRLTSHRSSLPPVTLDRYYWLLTVNINKSH